MDLVANFQKGNHIVVAVDGPAGSGKSSVCALVSQRLGWTYVNTGFLYRAVGLIAMRRGINLDDDQALLGVVQDVSENLQWRPEYQEVLIHGEDLAPLLYGDEVGQTASAIAKNAKLREALLPLQRRLALNSQKPAIIDGRDIGTVVFPDADLKIFLTASIEERALRRLSQIGSDYSPEEKQAALERLKQSMSQRDRQDEDRGTAPLRQAEDAVRLDTSSLSMDEVVERIIAMIYQQKLNRSE
ncbi:MAG: (d)CMP kinase [Oligoflexus sp.]